MVGIITAASAVAGPVSASGWAKWPRQTRASAHPAATAKASSPVGRKVPLELPKKRLAPPEEELALRMGRVKVATKAEQAKAKRMLASLLAQAAQCRLDSKQGYFRAANVLARKLGQKYEKSVQRALRKAVQRSIRHARAAVWWRRKRFKEAYVALLVATRLAQEGRPPPRLVEALRRAIEKTWRKRKQSSSNTSDLREAERVLLEEWAALR